MSSAFESSIGLAQYAHLAAALEGLYPTQSPRPASRAARAAASGFQGDARSPSARLDPAAAGGGSRFAVLPDSDAGVDERAATPLLWLETGSDVRSGPYAAQGPRRTAHGLGTAGWFAAEPAPLRLHRLETLESPPLGGRASAAVAAAQGCDGSSRLAWGLGVGLAHAQSVWEAAAKNPEAGSERAAGAARASAQTAVQAPGIQLGLELAAETDPRVSTRTVATRAGKYTFRAVELGRLAGPGNPAGDPAAGDSAPWPIAAASATAAPQRTLPLEHARDGVRASFTQAPEIGSGEGRGFGASGRVGDLALPTLVLLHGFLGAAEDWTTVAAGLGVEPRVSDPGLGAASWVRTERGGWRCLALDLPGHGGSAVDAARGGAPPLQYNNHRLIGAARIAWDVKRQWTMASQQASVAARAF